MGLGYTTLNWSTLYLYTGSLGEYHVQGTILGSIPPPPPPLHFLISSYEQLHHMFEIWESNECTYDDINILFSCNNRVNLQRQEI